MPPDPNAPPTTPPATPPTGTTPPGTPTTPTTQTPTGTSATPNQGLLQYLQQYLSNVNLGNAGNFSSDLFGSGPGKSGIDIQALLGQLGQNQQALQEAYVPTQNELDLKQQLADIQNTEAKQQLGAQAGILALRDQAIPQGLVMGQQGRLQEQANLQLQTLGIGEQALTRKLGLEQDARQIRVQAAQAGLSAAQANLQIGFQVYDKIRQDQQDVFDRAKTLNDIQRQNFADILDQFKGQDPSKLSAGAQGQIAQMAAARGISPDLVFSGLQTEYNLNQADLHYKQALTSQAQNQYQFFTDAFGNRFVGNTKTGAIGSPQGIGQSGPVQPYSVSGRLPQILQPYFRKTISGTPYIDGTNLSDTQKSQLESVASAEGITMVKDPAQVSALQEIDNSKQNLQYINDQFSQFLPKDASGRILGSALGNKLSQYIQTNDYIAASGSLRTAAISALRAAAGSTGFRINESEIQLSVDNDIPKVTDTVGVANQKLANLQKLFQDKENSILVKDRSTLAPQNKPVSQFFAVAPNGKTYYFHDQASLNSFKSKAGIK